MELPEYNIGSVGGGSAGPPGPGSLYGGVGAPQPDPGSLYGGVPQGQPVHDTGAMPEYAVGAGAQIPMDDEYGGGSTIQPAPVAGGMGPMGGVMPVDPAASVWGGLSIRNTASSLWRNVNPLAARTYDNVPKEPDGYEVRHLPNGTCYYYKLTKSERTHKEHDAKRAAGVEDISDTEDEDETDDEAEVEYLNLKKPKLFCSHGTLEKNYGIGVRLYFDFALILLIWNIVFFCLQLVPIIVAFARASNSYVDVQEGNVTTTMTRMKAMSKDPLSFLFTAMWDNKSAVWVWRAFNIVIILLAVCFVAPCYYCFTHCLFQRRGMADSEGYLASEVHDRIKYGDKTYNKHQRVCRVLASYVIFGLIVAGQLVVVCGLTIANNMKTWKDAMKVSGSVPGDKIINTIITYAVSIGISLIITILNTVWKVLCGVLTKFEKHTTWSTFRKHHTFKMVLFKILNVFCMGFFKAFLTNKCILTVLGTQYMIQLLLDVFVMNLVEMIVPTIGYCIKKGKIEKGPRRIIEMEKIKGDFDVSNEYYELIYRQYIIYVGLPAFPWISILAVISSSMELIVDKCKLIHMSKKPHETRGSVKSVVSFFLFFAAFMAAINWGGGTIYQLVGFYWCNMPTSIACPIIPGEKCIKLFSGELVSP